MGQCKDLSLISVSLRLCIWKSTDSENSLIISNYCFKFCMWSHNATIVTHISVVGQKHNYEKWFRCIEKRYLPHGLSGLLWKRSISHFHIEVNKSKNAVKITLMHCFSNFYEALCPFWDVSTKENNRISSSFPFCRQTMKTVRPVCRSEQTDSLNKVLIISKSSWPL